MASIDDLAKQILGQGITDRWTGEGFGNAEANARAMAESLANIGITDIKQFGQITVPNDVIVEPQYKFTYPKNADDVKNFEIDPESGSYIPKYEIESYRNPKTGEVYPASKVPSTKTVYLGEAYNDVMMAPVGTKKVLGNKVTNQPINQTTDKDYYYEQLGEDVFGGTRAGDGNTAYRVQLSPDGTPYFYTTYGSNSDLPQILSFAGMLGLALGIPMAGEALAGGVGAGLGTAGAGMGAAELAALDLALGGAGGSLGAAELGAALAGGAGGGAGLLEHVFDPTFGGELAPVIGGGAESVFDPTLGESALDAGMNAYPNTGNIGSPSSIKLSDAKRAFDAASKLTGGNQPAGSTKPVYDAAGKLISGGTAGATGTATGTDPLSALQQQASNASLLNFLGGKPELANIKSFKELFGEGLFGDSYVPPSAGGSQAAPVQYADLGTASQNEDEQQLFTGGHVDDFDVDALLQILRS